MKCDRCGREITEKESRTYQGETLCDDCYLDVRSSIKACDPWAVYSATRTREQSGLSGVEGLTELQKALCEFVQDRGKVTKKEAMEQFSLSESELNTQLAVIRHCELTRGTKEGDRIYLVPFR
jgi:hypothetical protein